MGEGDSGDLVTRAPTDIAFPGEDDEIGQLRQKIAADRAKLQLSIDSLQGEIEEAVDWQGWVADNPWKTVGLAFAVGFLWGSG